MSSLSQCSKLIVLPLIKQGTQREVRAFRGRYICYFTTWMWIIIDFVSVGSKPLFLSGVCLKSSTDHDLNPRLSSSGDDGPQIQMHRFPHGHLRLCPVGCWDYCPCPWGKVSCNHLLFLLPLRTYSILIFKAFNHKVGGMEFLQNHESSAVIIRLCSQPAGWTEDFWKSK